MYGFCRVIDLGILHFYFSSKNCSSKVYTYLEKVVVLVTISTEKLSLLFLDFLQFLIGFTSFSRSIAKGKESFCDSPPGTFQNITDRSLVCTKLPGKPWLCNVVQGGKGGAAGQIPARPAAGWPGKLLGRVYELLVLD
jgi:hypothetical protein